MQVIRHLQGAAGVPQSPAPKPKAKPAKAKADSPAAGASPAAAKAKKATPNVAKGTGGKGQSGATEPSSTKAGAAEDPAATEAHLSRDEAAREAKAALDSLTLPFNYKHKFGLRLEITR